ncbi:MAG: acetyl-CoA C-acyltransferase [Deltaproteobacteria bacterium]|nr:acetyl-CoA C-acyltransferase [Deltaproteobacteria bacterium]MDQ3296860.1 acetyl-CoA C-acyltransferase [Myxococcota bacterium]
MVSGTTRAAYLVDGIRSPFGRYGGGLGGVRADDLAGQVIAALVARTQLPVDRIDDVILGCANQAGEDNRNIARMAALLAGLPVGVPGVTVNRLCGSGMQAVADAARSIAAGDADLVIAGGVEHMSRAPLVMAKPTEAFARGNQTIYDTTLGWRFVNPRMEAMHGTLPMGETAERVAERCNVSREAQDRFALQSQQRAGKAIASGRVAQELTPIMTGTDKKTGVAIQLTADEHPRPDTTPEQLAKLRPAFVAKGSTTGSVTAGNASGLNDGAAVLLIASEQAVKELGLRPRARFVTGAAAGVEPSYMGLGPIPASKKVLTRAGLTPQQVELAEVNEAFAAQAIPCIDQLGLDPERVNVNGGAIAWGHPLGASGARLLLSLMIDLELTSRRIGLATMCIGVGQGIAVVLERA